MEYDPLFTRSNLFLTASLILSSEKNLAVRFISKTRRLSFVFERCLSHLRVTEFCAWGRPSLVLKDV